MLDRAECQQEGVWEFFAETRICISEFLHALLRYYL